MSDGETDFESIGREVVRLWQRAAKERHSKAQFGDDVDMLLCWGAEVEREQARRKREREREQAHESTGSG